ncbi:MAG TPA: PASTA domain-containing protein [Micromonosporaceae bacterium]|jgi:hypothetical protein
MADDEQPRDGAPDRGEAAGVPGEGPADDTRPSADQQPILDETSEFDPFAEVDESEPGRASGEAGAGGPAPDETAAFPGAGMAPGSRGGDETAAFPRGDETTAFSRGDETAVVPPGDQTAVLRPAQASWSGRAGVPPGGVREGTPADWEGRDLGEDGHWWLPIVIGVVALLLLGVLGLGIWLAARNSNDRPATPATPATSAPVAPTSAATSSVPTTTPARPTPSKTTAAVSVVVPQLAGLDEATARAILDDLQLQARTQTRQSDTVRAGRVIETEPAAGDSVPPGTQIILIVATAPPTTAPPTTPAADNQSASTGQGD